MKALVDQEACVGCGLCPEICPEVFRMNDSDRAEVYADPVPKSNEESCREAADRCPVAAITIA